MLCVSDWVVSVVEQSAYVPQRHDFELLRTAIDHFALEGVQQAVGRHNDRAGRQCALALLERRDVSARDVGLPDGARGEVEQTVAVTADLAEE